MKENATGINVQIQSSVGLQRADLRESYQHHRWGEWIHHSHLQVPLDLGHNTTVTQGGRDTIVQTIDFPLLAATNNLLGFFVCFFNNEALSDTL